MFCPKCGSKIGDGAKFCTACGLPLGPLAPVDAVGPSQDVTPNSGETPSKESHAQVEAVPKPAARPADAERSRMFNFFMHERKVAGRLVPQFVIMIAAFIAAAGIAYAAFMVYKNVVEPSFQQPVHKEQTVKKRNMADTAKSDSTKQVNENAHTAYQDVLAQYREALTNGDYDDYGSSGSSNGETNGNGYFTDNSSNSKYPLVNDMVGNASGMYSSGVTAETSQYAFVDLNNDGIDELLLRDSSDAEIYAVYGYIDGQVKGLLQGWERNFYSLRGNHLLLEIMSGGMEENHYSVLKYQSGPSFETVDCVDESSDSQGAVITTRTKSGKEVERESSSTDAAEAKARELFDQIKQDYPEDTSVSWQSLLQ